MKGGTREFSIDGKRELVMRAKGRLPESAPHHSHCPSNTFPSFSPSCYKYNSNTVHLLCANSKKYWCPHRSMGRLNGGAFCPNSNITYINPSIGSEGSRVFSCRGF